MTDEILKYLDTEQRIAELGEVKMNMLKCDYCGRFIPFKDRDNAYSHTTYSNGSEPEPIQEIYKCIKCRGVKEGEK